MIRSLIFNLTNLALLRFKYFKVRREYNLIKYYQFRSIEDHLEIQKRRLYHVLNYSIGNIPYYQKIAIERNIKINYNTVWEDIKMFPILTKEIIRKNWHELHPILEKKNYIINTSGGTTGEPLRFIQDEDYILHNLSSTLAFDEIGGYFVGDRLIKLWGDEKEIIEHTKGMLKKITYRFLKNTIFLNSFKMSEKKMFEFVNIINRKKPKVIIAYVQSIYELAKFIQRCNLKKLKVKSIITSAGVLTPNIRSFLENIFDCKVFNRYGSREVGMIAHSCEKSDKLHLNMFQQYIEILDEKNNPVKENEKGNLIITNLSNFGMPLIRYSIGDRSSYTLSPCSCGRGSLQLNSIYGRVVDVFTNEEGDLIDGEYFTHLFYFKDNIKKFQVVQEELNGIVINLVTINNQKLNPKIEKEISEKIKLVMGENCKVNYHYKSDIDPSISGKFRYTISKI